MTTNSHLVSMAFKMNFLRAMLPIMGNREIGIYTDISIRFMNGSLSGADITEIDILYRKFEERTPNAEIPKTE